MAGLKGTKPQETYQGLIKTIDNQEVSGDVQLSDGNGNALPITISSTQVKVNGESLTSFTYNQTTASNTWSITHNMGKRPSVTVVNSAGQSVIGEVSYINVNQLTVQFKNPFKGKAYLN